MKWVKALLIIIGALSITAFGIDASDTLRGESSTMLAQLIGTEKESPCPKGMQVIGSIPSLTCADAYEASPSIECAHKTPQNSLETQDNLLNADCHADSKSDDEPWRFVTRDQALQLCARAGKRLPTNAEWYALALSAPQKESVCNTTGGNLAKGGSFQECKTSDAVYDLVGNVWEWVRDDVASGTYQGVPLAETGYVAQVNSDGMAVISSTTPQSVFGNDYFWTQSEGVFGIIRGGYYGSGDDAGLYAVHADTPPTSATAGIGFRCVK